MRQRILMVDRGTGNAVAITLRRDEQALKASEERASALRKDVSQLVGAADQPTVERFEVAIFEV